MDDDSLVFISERRVSELLEWDELVDVVEQSIISVSNGQAVQNPRNFLHIRTADGLMGTMSGYVPNTCCDIGGALACKLVNVFPKNPARPYPLPAIMANIVLFDDQTGELKCMMGGIEITAWRTAAASVIATKHLHAKRPGRKCRILAILGSGTQGRSHTVAFQHFFKFDEVRIWNHHAEKAQSLVQELRDRNIYGNIKFAPSVEACVQDADVIVTATFADRPFLERKWVNNNVHINAIGAGVNHHSELAEDLYKAAWICTDYWAGARTELAGLAAFTEIKAELGELIIGKVPPPSLDQITIFHSLGMAAEDAATAKLIFEKYQKAIRCKSNCGKKPL